MTDTSCDLGLLLDVDGPIASPVTRSINVPSIARDLAQIANAGVPIAFNTGRSDGFLREQVVPPLLDAGLTSAARLWGICEKGAVWMPITADGSGEVHIDSELSVPDVVARDIEILVTAQYSDLMFFDRTKHAMVSLEQNTDVSNDAYLRRQPEFDERVGQIFESRGMGYEWQDRRVPDASGNVEYRIDPTIISTDVESIRVGKDLGAKRMIGFLRNLGASIPGRWRTMGDSRTDYAMADWLHENGFDVAHVDVRPSDGVPETPYPVRHHAELIHDEAGAAYIARWAAMVRGEADDDADV